MRGTPLLIKREEGCLVRNSTCGRFASSVAALLLAVVPPCVATSSLPDDLFCQGTDIGTILNVAHAGASSLAPQNTMAAGRVALEVGADVWGIDVRRTRDGVFVLMHDETIDRTTNVEELFPERSPWRVADFSLDEIRTLDAGSWFVEQDPFHQIAEGNVSADEATSYIGEPIPTLREALDFVAANHWLIDVEVKAPLDVDFDTAASELVSLIRNTGTQNRVLISSFYFDLLRAVHRIAPDLPIGALSILPPLAPMATLKSLGIDVYLPSVVGFTDALLADLEEAGIHVIVWTYNSRSQLHYATELLGVDGVYTDFPQRLALLGAASSP